MSPENGRANRTDFRFLGVLRAALRTRGQFKNRGLVGLLDQLPPLRIIEKPGLSL
jgi:hypothetical protein